jgi:hypothetical protein
MAPPNGVKPPASGSAQAVTDAIEIPRLRVVGGCWRRPGVRARGRRPGSRATARTRGPNLKPAVALPGHAGGGQRWRLVGRWGLVTLELESFTGSRVTTFKFTVTAPGPRP